MRLIEKIQTNLNILSIDSDEIRKNLITAQMEVLSSIQHPDLMHSNFDLIFDYLREAIEMSETKLERNDIIKKASYMIHAMTFFFQAKYLYEVQKRDEEGKKLIEKGCDMISKSLASFANNPSQVGLAISAQELMKSMFEGDDSFFKKIIIFFSRNKEIAKQRGNYVRFVEKLIPKLERNYDLVGKSYLISEIIQNHKDDVIEYKYPSYEFPQEYVRSTLIYLVVLNTIAWVLWFIIGLFSTVGSFIRDIFNIRTDSLTLSETLFSYIVSFSSISAGLLLFVVVISSVIYLFKNISINRRRNKKKKYYDLVSILYTK